MSEYKGKSLYIGSAVKDVRRILDNAAGAEFRAVFCTASLERLTISARPAEPNPRIGITVVDGVHRNSQSLSAARHKRGTSSDPWGKVCAGTVLFTVVGLIRNVVANPRLAH